MTNHASSRGKVGMFVGVTWLVLTVLGATAGTVTVCVCGLLLLAMVSQPPQEDVAEVLTAVRATHPEATTMRVIEFVRARRTDLDVGTIYPILVGLRRLGVVESYERETAPAVPGQTGTGTVSEILWKPKGPLPPRTVGRSVRMLLARAGT